MKNKKTEIGEILGELLAEVVVAAVLFSIGAIVVDLVGIDFAELDVELIAMIGVVALLVFLLIVSIVVTAIKKLFKRKDNNPNTADDDNIHQSL